MKNTRNSARGIAFGIVTLGSRTSSPSVAIRAYPANAKNRNPADCNTSRRPASNGTMRPTSACESNHPATTTPVSVTSATASSTRVIVTVRVNPPRFTAAIISTAAMASTRAWSGERYAPTVSAIAAQDAVLPTTKPQPARKPQNGPSCLRAYTYVPPDSGWIAASCADDVALQKATIAATPRPINSAVPAASAAGAQAAKTPAPIIEPTPMTIASPTPSWRFNPAATAMLSHHRATCLHASARSPVTHAHHSI